jgi:hypothetical protein
MATKKQPDVATRHAVIRIGYDSYVLPVSNAAAVVEALATAEKIESDGYGDERMYYIGGGDAISLHLELLPEHSYLQGKFAGPKATYTHDEDINQ